MRLGEENASRLFCVILRFLGDVSNGCSGWLCWIVLYRSLDENASDGLGGCWVYQWCQLRVVTQNRQLGIIFCNCIGIFILFLEVRYAMDRV